MTHAAIVLATLSLSTLHAPPRAVTACASEGFTPGAEAKALVKAGAVLVDVLSSKGTQYTVGKGGALDLTLAPVSGVLLIPKGDVK